MSYRDDNKVRENSRSKVITCEEQYNFKTRLLLPCILCARDFSFSQQNRVISTTRIRKRYQETLVDAFLRSVLQLRKLYFKDESDFSFNLTIYMASQKCRCKIKGNKKCSQRQMNSRTRKGCTQPLISSASTSPFPPEGFQRSRS